MQNIAVIGAGGTGHALAAILASKGHHVCLADTPAYQECLEQTKSLGAIHLTGAAVLSGRPAVVTTDIGLAVRKSQLIICCTISNRDEELAEIIAPHLNDRHAVLIAAGNGGSILYHRIFARHGHSGTLVGEVAGNFFPCRMTSPGHILIGLPLSPKGAAAFPPANTAQLIERFQAVWELQPCTSLFEAMFNGPNIICHGAGVAANLAAIDRSGGRFNLFKDGLSPAFLNLTDMLWEEKRSVYEEMGCQPAPPPRGMLSGVMDPDNPDYRYFREMDGPGSLEHRYISEDVPCLLCFFVSIARRLKVPVPLFSSIIRLLSAATGTDYYAEGRTLEALGLDTLSREELIAFFRVPD